MSDKNLNAQGPKLPVVSIMKGIDKNTSSYCDLVVCASVQCSVAKLLIYFTYRLSGWKFRFDIFQVFSFQLK